MLGTVGNDEKAKSGGLCEGAPGCGEQGEKSSRAQPERFEEKNLMCMSSAMIMHDQ